ncbi:hypothetical protein AVEN_216947-1, partial [Araneus ventricosus]
LSNKLWIHGPSEAPRGNTVTLSCETDVSNPKSELSWTVDGQPVEKAEENVRETTDGWITTSNITITLNRQVNSSIHASHIKTNRFPVHSVMHK